MLWILLFKLWGIAGSWYGFPSHPTAQVFQNSIKMKCCSYFIGVNWLRILIYICDNFLYLDPIMYVTLLLCYYIHCIHFAVNPRHGGQTMIAGTVVLGEKGGERGGQS